MKLSQFYTTEKFGLSFELFPPKTERGEAALFRHLEELLRFHPDYITCTYGAGGSTRDKTLDIISRVKQQYHLPVASHLTCVQATKDDLRTYLNEAKDRGIEHIVALRGDPPGGEDEFKPVPGGLRYANELVELLQAEFPQFGIAVAGYPETHREAPGAEEDLANLKRKVDAGAEVVITQLFYDNVDFFDFRQRYEASGIEVPLIPGILPITNLAQIQRISSLCGARLPESLVSRLEAFSEDEQGQFEVGVEYAVKQVQQLVDAKIAGLHFYVLNKSQATSRVLDALKLPPDQQQLVG